MQKPVRIGIIGCGDVMTAYMFQAQQLRSRDMVEVVYACDQRQDKEPLMREHYRVPRFSTDFRQLLAFEGVDLVLVLTSMPTHGLLASAALQAGKHVLVEKPMAVSLEEAAGLVKLTKASPGYLVCAPYVILSPTYQIMGKRIQDGDIGKVLTARARYGHAGPTWGSWYYQQGGGAIFDLAPYNLTSLTGWLGPARRVTAMTGVAIPERLVDGDRTQVEAEDNAHILVDFGHNVFAVVTAAFTMQQYRTPALELYGTQGALQMMGDDWDPDGYEYWRNEVGAWQVFRETDPGWLWTDGLRHLVECIQEKKPPAITPEHAYHVLEIMVKAKQSGKDGRAHQVVSAFPNLHFEADLDTGKTHLIHDRTHQRDALSSEP